MQRLVDTYENMKQHNQAFKVRETLKFSFGTFEECKKLLHDALKLIDKTAEIIWLPEYDQVADWMSNNQGKGLLLSGDCGRGKSNIVMFAMPLLFLHHFRKIAEPIHVQQLPDRLKQKSFMKRWSYTVDEVGAEPETSDYGVKYFPFMNLINEAEINLKVCLFSTNLNSMQMLEKYDNRTLDRLIRLCRVVKFEGDSLRK